MCFVQDCKHKIVLPVLQIKSKQNFIFTISKKKTVNQQRISRQKTNFGLIKVIWNLSSILLAVQTCQVHIWILDILVGCKYIGSFLIQNDQDKYHRSSKVGSCKLQHRPTGLGIGIQFFQMLLSWQ
jgi:hypothetical protein